MKKYRAKAVAVLPASSVVLLSDRQLSRRTGRVKQVGDEHVLLVACQFKAGEELGIADLPAKDNDMWEEIAPPRRRKKVSDVDV